MGAVRGALVSSIGLVLLYDVIAPVDAAGNISSNVPTLFGLPGKVADYIINPNKPLIPDLRASSKATTKALPPGTVLGSGTIPTGPLGALGSVGSLLGISLQQPTPSAPPPSSSSSSSGSGIIRAA